MLQNSQRVRLWPPPRCRTAFVVPPPPVPAGPPSPDVSPSACVSAMCRAPPATAAPAATVRRPPSSPLERPPSPAPPLVTCTFLLRRQKGARHPLLLLRGHAGRRRQRKGLVEGRRVLRVLQVLHVVLLVLL